MANKQSQASARVALDPVPFEDGAKAVISAANKMSAAVTAAFAAAGAAVLVAFGAKTISGLVDTLKEVILFGEQMANAGKKAGLAAGQYYLFNSALEKGIGLKTAAALLGTNADALNRSANVFRDVSIKLWVVGEKIRGFWLGLMERVAPVLSRLLDGTLGFELVSAGQAFGEQIAKAVEVIYQLALDGKLWTAIKNGFQLAFDYAGERLLWLAGLASDLLQEATLNGLVSGIDASEARLGDFCSHLAKLLTDTFYKFWTDVVQVVYDMLGAMDEMLNKVTFFGTKLIPDDYKAQKVRSRSQEVADMRQVSGGSKNYEAVQGDSFAEKMAGIFAKNQFKPTDDLADQISNFGKTINETLSKYQAGESSDPTKTFENNNRRAAFGADSNAAIGAGGNVYVGLSVLDVNKAQLRVLESIDGKLSGRGGESAGVSYGGDLQYGGISRAQTSSPLTSVYTRN